MDWKEIAGEVAKIGLPLLGAALPLPGGAAIGTGLAAMLGATSDAPEHVLEALKDPAAFQKAREFELTHQETLLRITTQAELDGYKAEVEDRNAARARSVALAQAGQRNYTATSMYVLAVLVIIGLTWQVLDTSMGLNEFAKGVITLVLGRFLGYLDNIYNYEYGTTRSSKAKDETIKQLAQ